MLDVHLEQVCFPLYPSLSEKLCKKYLLVIFELNFAVDKGFLTR